MSPMFVVGVILCCLAAAGVVGLAALTLMWLLQGHINDE